MNSNLWTQFLNTKYHILTVFLLDKRGGGVNFASREKLNVPRQGGYYLNYI